MTTGIKHNLIKEQPKIVDNKTFRDETLKDTPLTNEVYANCKFYSCILSAPLLEKVRFVNCVLHDCEIERSTLWHVVFANCQLERTSFICSTLSSCKFIKCSLTDCDFGKGTIHELRIIQTRLTRCDIIDIIGEAHNISLIQCYLEEVHFRNSSLQGFKVVATTFKNSQFFRCAWQSSDIGSTIFDSCDINELQLDKVHVGETMFLRSTFTHCSFGERIRLLQVTFSDSFIVECSFLNTRIFDKIIVSPFTDVTAVTEGSGGIISTPPTQTNSNTAVKSTKVENESKAHFYCSVGLFTKKPATQLAIN